jgi:hypothetical protein
MLPKRLGYVRINSIWYLYYQIELHASKYLYYENFAQ